MKTIASYPDTRDLHRYLNRRASRSNDAVKEVSVTPVANPGSYFSARIAVEYRGGRSERLFFKDLSHSYKSKDDITARRDREIHVYRDILEDLDLGTAALVDIHNDDANGRCWLFLEDLTGTIIQDANDDLGFLAASWLAALQGSFLDRAEQLVSDEHLVQHNAAFFAAPVENALGQVRDRAPNSGAQLSEICSTYEEVIDLLAGQPRTLVHGGFIPWHVIVDTATSPPRVSAIDWELAAAGSPLYDLAYFSHWANPQAQERMYAAYRTAAVANGVIVPSDTDMRQILAAVKLYRTIAWLAQSAAQNYSATKVAKLVRRAARLSHAARA
ncbi:MAG: aminoglycoside phosphotransferase family protein [Acidimicrobiia bacterium]|nr:aminoglycoside phosphotransferase family protein [Acidimicrobiia bacterium]NNL28271.1 aminoglycoside phosphotransferase family protein [Acidimicrobiia bacterium]